jgi:flagellar FliL protein
MAEEAETADAEEEPPKKKSKGMLFGLIGALLLGGGAFYGVYSGMIPLPFGEEKAAETADAGYGEDEGDKEVGELEPTAFVPLEEMIISLGPDAAARHLKVRISLEVAPEAQDSVTQITPRIIDVLNTFLRAVDEREFELPRAMIRMRAQMLRRVKLVTPENAVRDVLIQEFVLS